MLEVKESPEVSTPNPARQRVLDINVSFIAVVLLIKPCNISPRLLFVPVRQLMSPKLSQRETKAQRMLHAQRSQRPLVQPRRSTVHFVSFHKRKTANLIV